MEFKRLVFLLVALSALLLPTNAAGAEDMISAECFDCHGYEGMTSTLPSGEEMDLYVPYSTYEQSVHGQMGFTCDFCHVGYTDYPHPEREFTTLRAYSITYTDVCADCHMEQSATYLEDFHGKTVSIRKQTSVVSGTATTVAPEAVCSDCHGAHDILPPDNPASSVYPVSLAETCGECHKEATPQFALAFSKHKRPSPEEVDTAFTYWINKFYEILIPGLIGALVFFIILEVAHPLWVRREKA